MASFFARHCTINFNVVILLHCSFVNQVSEKSYFHCLTPFFSVEGEFQFAQSMDGNTTEEIQEALEESIKG